ncbi:hypothetical protein BGZ98_008631, partial [Dissophora globulifera]
ALEWTNLPIKPVFLNGSEMGVARAFEVTKDCKAIKRVDPQEEGPCDIDGSAVSYMRFKATEDGCCFSN